MLKILALVLLISSLFWYMTSPKNEKRSKTAVLINQAEQSIEDAQISVDNANSSFQKIKAKDN